MRFLPGLACLLVLSLGEQAGNAAEGDLQVADIQARADAGDPVAMVGFAMLLLDGSALAYDADRAATLITIAAETGNRHARLMLAVMLEEGLGMARDRDRAAQLIEELAESGLPEALYRRAQLRAASDPEAAMLDLQLAGAQGHVPALQVLATLRNWDELLANRDGETTARPAVAEPPDVNVIIAIQAMLGQLGYNPGVPNGQQTPETTTAIVLYQVAQDLPTDGRPTVALRDHIAKVLREGGQ
ncbi:peptidoglycan-binding protein [Alisedimentitalea sp. MJ-SS2]|uniref:peptidoglycan-binding protein n=1 Tax=Aliisedimentitalea sp. MJ-SS2 TaxID=3049795 RepID=UPI002913312F|nr:peptidoglycan-binding protein [Alisedimentitalea sp. MJ-SS2]MDU8928539.1 peptidoglycan-binding protein [Alisedimentitalea sp. MJ-SS2]